MEGMAVRGTGLQTEAQKTLENTRDNQCTLSIKTAPLACTISHAEDHTRLVQGLLRGAERIQIRP